MTLTARGSRPGETVDITLHSTPIALGTATADADGTVVGTVTIPADVEPGVHTIVLVGQTSGVDGDGADRGAAAADRDAARPAARHRVGIGAAGVRRRSALLLARRRALVAQPRRRRRGGRMRLMARSVRASALALAGRVVRAGSRRRPRVPAAPVGRPARRRARAPTRRHHRRRRLHRFGDGVQVRCAPQPVAAGFDALDARRGSPTRAPPRFPGLLCRIDGEPAIGPVPRRAAGRSLLGLLARAARRSWTYSTRAPAAASRRPGSVEGWAFGDEVEPGSTARPRRDHDDPPAGHHDHRPLPAAPAAGRRHRAGARRSPDATATPSPAAGASDDVHHREPAERRRPRRARPRRAERARTDDGGSTASAPAPPVTIRSGRRRLAGGRCRGLVAVAGLGAPAPRSARRRRGAEEEPA